MEKCKLCEAPLEDVSKELCEFCEGLQNIKVEKSIKTKEVKKVPIEKIKTVKLICKLCGRIEELRVNKPELYTEEVKKNWECFRHTTFKRKEQ